MKYIMYETPLGDDMVQKIPVIFPNNLVHELVGQAFELSLRAHHFDPKPVSAGTVSIFGTQISCSGGSSTMKLKSNPEDASVIHNHDYFSGIEVPDGEEILQKALKDQPRTPVDDGKQIPDYDDTVHCGD